MNEHPIQQRILSLETYFCPDGGAEGYVVGGGNVTEIVACVKSGLHADIPYFRVMAGEKCLAEFCQHNIIGVYFEI